MVHASVYVAFFLSLDGALKPGMRLSKSALARQTNADLMQATAEALMVHSSVYVTLFHDLNSPSKPQMGFLELAGFEQRAADLMQHLGIRPILLPRGPANIVRQKPRAPREISRRACEFHRRRGQAIEHRLSELTDLCGPSLPHELYDKLVDIQSVALSGVGGGHAPKDWLECGGSILMGCEDNAELLRLVAGDE